MGDLRHTKILVLFKNINVPDQRNIANKHHWYLSGGAGMVDGRWVVSLFVFVLILSCCPLIYCYVNVGHVVVVGGGVDSRNIIQHDC